MKTITLRPPLPPSLSHDGVRFVVDEGIVGAAGTSLSARVIAAIAASLQTILPPEGDLFVDASGAIVGGRGAIGAKQSLSLWYHAGLLEGVERSRR
jgi:hypothetical protein